MEKVSNISKLLFENTHSLMTLMTHELGKCGITLPQAFFLETIAERPRTIGEISELIDLSYSTVSGIADRLERQGIIERYRDKEDRRVVWIRFSEGCEELENKFPVLDREYFPRFFSELFQEIPDEDLEKLHESLALIYNCLEKKRKTIG
ncbi:MAG TPA: MarR family transcriptional regulator [Bacillota bacterium]|nr:MarR family transcriptional regulator [Bacillota bacterium]